MFYLHIDSEEFLYLLFENALNIPEFIKYSNGNKDFMHQIVVKPKDRSRCQDIQFLLETSMEINNLKFKELPLPALMLCMPRCNGRLVYYEAIIPSMSLNIGSFIDKGIFIFSKETFTYFFQFFQTQRNVFVKCLQRLNAPYAIKRMAMWR